MTPEQQKALEALQALHAENERLGLYKDAYAQSMTTQTQVRSTKEALSVEDTLKLAIKAMESFQSGTNGLYEGEFQEEVNAIKAALEAHKALSTKCVAQPAVAEQHKRSEASKPLTIDQIASIAIDRSKPDGIIAFVRAIEAAHGIKE